MISLAMPTYNGEKYLREQLDSIYQQTIVPDEVIVVDDNSNDNTIKILQEYKERYGLIYFVNEQNLGYNKNFEKAISLCSGDYIALCDQDDIWLPTKIEKTYNVLKTFPKKEPSLVSCFSSKYSTILSTKGLKCKGGDWKHCYSLFVSQGCTLMFNKKLKELIFPFPENMTYDGYIALTASLIGNRVYLGEELMYYRIHNNNAFQKKEENNFILRIQRQLKNPIPLFFGYERYLRLLYIRNRFREIAIPSHLEYLNNIISLYETKGLKKIYKFSKIKEIPKRIRFVSALLSLAKIVFKIKDVKEIS